MTPMGITLAVCLLLTSPFVQGGPIILGETHVTNDYPETVAFEVKVASTAGTIISVAFNVTSRGGDTARVMPAEFAPGRDIIARQVLDVRRERWPPGTPIHYTWTVRDDAGNVFTSEPEEYILMDARFTWQSLENDDVILWWYEGDDESVQSVFDSAARALAAMEANTVLTLSYRVHILLYADSSDFGAWHEYRREWVWGEAYPGVGVTVQIIPPGRSSSIREWIENVIPHEIAHLFFFEVTDTPFGSSPPTWLVEGFAQYHEFSSPEDQLDWVRRVARRGELLPLRALSGTFTGDDDKIHLMYAESLSAVTFLFERWGEEGVGRLLSAYKAGHNTDKALNEALGLDFEEFQLAWWQWLGGLPDMYPTRAPTREPATPEPVWTLPSPPTALPVATPTSTSGSSTPDPVVAPTSAPTAAASPTPITEPPDSAAGGGPCAGVFGLAAVVAMLGWRRPGRRTV